MYVDRVWLLSNLETIHNSFIEAALRAFTRSTNYVLSTRRNLVKLNQ